MPDVLNIQSTVQCPHGGTVALFTTNTRVRAGGALAMIVGDTSTVNGCPFNTGSNPSPCVQVLWVSGAGRATAGALLLNLASSGFCFNPAGVPQGVATIANTQSEVAAQ